MANISGQFLAREKEYLSRYACLTENTRGREKPIEPCPNRTEFQRDRDRIIHSKSFRRLMHKTQVFCSPVDEHYRTRLTHTMEVSQVARIIARALSLNEDLVEAIALGHDLGHTPFGHAGEDALRRCFDPDFAHNEQSLRVVDRLEKDGKGLNLTFEVRDGILNHSGGRMASTLEGVVVKYADRIAYINHDIDDAIRAGVLSSEDLPKEAIRVLGKRNSERINTMVTAVIEASTDSPVIRMTPEKEQAMAELRAFLFKNIYRSDVIRAEEDKAKEMLVALYEYYVNRPEELPDLYRIHLDEDGVARCVADYLSGMTDRYAISCYTKLFIPEVWRGNNT